MTQEALAGVAGIEAATLSRYEAGHWPLSVPLLVRLAEALGVAPATLLDTDEDAVVERAPEEEDLLRVWRGMSGERREALLRFLKTLG